MKHLSLVVLSSSLSALPMGNPAEPQIVYRGIWASEAATFALKTGYQGDVVFDRKFDKDHSHNHFFSNQGIITLNYIDRLELYGGAGAIAFDSKNRFTASGGGKILLGQWGDTGMGIDGKYQWSRPLREYQVAFGVFQNIGWFIPYVGVKYSNIHARAGGKKLFSDLHYGMALGCSVSSGKIFDLNFEVDLIDELAISFGGNIQF